MMSPPSIGSLATYQGTLIPGEQQAVGAKSGLDCG